jgi:hypothetical protein
MENFVPENIDLLGCQSVWASDIFVVCRILSNKSAFLKQSSVFGESLCLCKFLDVPQ